MWETLKCNGAGVRKRAHAGMEEEMGEEIGSYTLTVINNEAVPLSGSFDLTSVYLTDLVVAIVVIAAIICAYLIWYAGNRERLALMTGKEIGRGEYFDHIFRPRDLKRKLRDAEFNAVSRFRLKAGA